MDFIRKFTFITDFNWCNIHTLNKFNIIERRHYDTYN
jgi:hypothetical protein